MSNRVNYLYSGDYKGFSIPQGITLSGAKNGNMQSYSSQPRNSNQQVTSASTFSYQPSTKEGLVTSGVSPQTYYQPYQYASQQNRLSQRPVSPLILQHHAYGGNSQSNSSNAPKYQVPYYQQNSTLANTLSAEKTTIPNHQEQSIQKSAISYIPQQQSAIYNSNLPLRSPYVSNFTPSTTQTTQLNNGKTRSISAISGQQIYTPQIAQNLTLSSGIVASSINSSIPSSSIASTGNNTNIQQSSNSYQNIYQSIQQSKIGGNTNSIQINPSQEISTSNNSYQKTTVPFIHTRSYSTNTQINPEFQLSAHKDFYARQDSLSPSKRVTFNLSRNTYTDIDQIEKRLNESTRLRPADEVDDSRDRTSTATFQANSIEDDLAKRFDQAINRSEKIVIDCYRVERENIQSKSDLESSFINGSTTPTGTKMVRNPSRSKSPIKSSLKRNSSFTGSPLKSQNTTPTNAASGLDSSVQIQGQQKFSDMLDYHLTTQPNKVINNLNNTEKQITLQQTNQNISQNQPIIENQNKPSSLNLTTNISSSISNSSSIPPSYLTNTNSLNLQQNDKSPTSSFTQPSFVSTSTQPQYVVPQTQPQFVASSIQKQVGNGIGGFDESSYLKTTTSDLSLNAGRSVTPTKYNYSNIAPSTGYLNSQSYTSQLNDPQFLRASYYNKTQTTKESESNLISSIPLKPENNNSSQAENPENSFQMKPEQVLNNNETQNLSLQQQDKFINDQKRYTPQYTTPIKPRKGILRYSDGSRYDGEILNSQRHGYGTLLSVEFSVIYQGDWQNDTYHGQGKFLNPMAENLFEEYDYKDFDIALSQYWESYEGEFFEGKLNGFGTLMLTNGEKLVGNFKKGRISGKGTFYCNKGAAVTGTWEDNRIVEKF